MPKRPFSRGGAGDRRRVHVLYKGRVQGVGFRFTVEAIALERGLKGWVKNLPNGDVEMVAEGPQSKVTQLLEKISQSRLGSHVQKTITHWEPYVGDFTDFRIEFAYGQ